MHPVFDGLLRSAAICLGFTATLLLTLALVAITLDASERFERTRFWRRLSGTLREESGEFSFRHSRHLAVRPDREVAR